MKVLDCLCIWKDNFLLPYEQHLKNLSSSDSLREELTTWSFSKESHQIEEHHRAYLLPVVIRILMPKVRKSKKHASRKVLIFQLYIWFYIVVFILSVCHTLFSSLDVCVCKMSYVSVGLHIMHNQLIFAPIYWKRIPSPVLE